MGGSCWRSAGVCERAAQHSRSVCSGCEKNGNNHWSFTAEIVKGVFILFATRGHDILHSDWGEKILRRSPSRRA